MGMGRKKIGSVKRDDGFSAVVKISGINPYVDVPERVVKVLGDGRKAAVLVKLSRTEPVKSRTSAAARKERLDRDASHLKAIGRLAHGDWFRCTLVPLRSDATRLYLDAWMRETSGVAVGDRVRVRLKRARGSRELPMPAALSEALTGNAKALAAWEALTPSRRREILTYLNFLKTPSALERNVQKTIAGLLSKENPSG
jgi:hypothetical protein